jgi:hypothetical protein
MQRYFRLLIIALCLTLAFTAIFAVKKSGSGKAKPKKITEEAKPVVPEVKIPQEDILAEYKGGLITKKDLQDKIAKLPAQNQARFKTIEGQTQMLDIMVVEEVFWLKANDMNLLTDKVVLDKINAAKKQVLVQEYYKLNVNEKTQLSEGEKQAYYAENKKEFYQAPYTTIMYIQPADESAAKKALSELNKGVPFETVSSNYSISTYAKSVKGKIKSIRGNGTIPGIGNDAALDSIITNSPVDTLRYLGPLKTSSGWSIIQVREKIEGVQRTYLECEAEVDQRMRPKKEAELLKQITQRLKLEYNVVIDTTNLGKMNLREPQKNAELEDIAVVTASDPSLGMTIGQLSEKFMNLSPQEQMMYAKNNGALQMVEQDLNRNLMFLDALKDKSLDEFLDKNEDYKQSKRYYVLQEAYKRLVLDSLVVTNEDLRSYYDSHLADYTTPAARKVTAVWCKDEKTAEKARKLMIKAVKKNDSIAITKILKKYNLKSQQETLDNNYNNGIVSTIGADAELSKVIWKTPVGTVSEISRSTRNDVIFFYVIEERPAATKSFTEVESRLQNQLRKEKANTRMEEVKQQLFTAYGLKKYPEKLEIKLTADELFEMADSSARQRKFKDATVYYDQIVKFYPNGTDDYKASFMKAFLVAEDMADKEQGLLLFKDFLKKFPTGELNESAQYMIDELEGKNPQFEEADTENK